MVMTPSWLSEFLQTLNSKGYINVTLMKSINASVSESIRFVDIEKTGN